MRSAAVRCSPARDDLRGAPTDAWQRPGNCSAGAPPSTLGAPGQLDGRAAARCHIACPTGPEFGRKFELLHSVGVLPGPKLGPQLSHSASPPSSAKLGRAGALCVSLAPLPAGAPPASSRAESPKHRARRIQSMEHAASSALQQCGRLIFSSSLKIKLPKFRDQTLAKLLQNCAQKSLRGLIDQLAKRQGE